MDDKAQLIHDIKKYSKPAPSEHRGIRGRVKYHRCEHGVVSVDEWESTGDVCGECHQQKNRTFFIPNMEPSFNYGLGCVTHGTRDAERIAKSRGLEALGDADMPMPSHTEDNSKII